MIRQHQVANLSFDDEKQPTYKSNFLSIKRHFNLLDKNTEHFVNTNDICTPIDCVVEMVDKIPLSFFEKKELKILDPCCGNGNFHAYLSKKTPLQNLFFNDINAHRLANVQQFFGKDVHISSIDFLEMDESKKYDLIVANPPYAKIIDGKRVSKNHNMSRDFIRKALRMTKKDGFMLFIVPNNWMSFSDRNDLPRLLSEYQFLHIDVGGAKKYFPTVGSSFSWFLLQKTANKNSFTFVNHYVIKNQEKVSLKKGVDFIPLFYDNAVKSILEKVIANNSEKYRVETSSHLHNHTKKSFLSDEKTADFHFKIIHTPTKIRYANIAHKYQNGYKVFISLTNQYKTFIDNCGMTQSIAFVRCENKAQAERIKRELDSEVFKFIVNITRYGNFNNIRVLQALSRVNTFQLSDKENETIRKFNMVYYGKKNKNIVPLTKKDLQGEINYKDFQYKEHFFHLCNLTPNKEKERLEIETINETFFDKKGCVYVFVIEGKVLKIGQTIQNIKSRVGSYNTGKVEYRINGTNSTTNYFILQSILKINKTVNVYAFFPEEPKFTLFGKEYQDTYPPVKVAENKIINDFIAKHKRKPIGCTQT